MGLGELGVILAILVLMFGAKRLPEVAKGLGRSIRSFKEGVDDLSEPVKGTEARSEGEEKKKDG